MRGQASGRTAYYPGYHQAVESFEVAKIAASSLRNPREMLLDVRRFTGIRMHDAEVRMSVEKREYNGAALNSFILALGHSHNIVQRILADAGVDRIDPERWYDLEWASSIYYKIGAEVGPAALIQVGRKMIESAEYPGGIDSIHTLLMALGVAYRLNARGPDIGEIVCTIEDEHSATMVWTPKFPCALNIGILEGSCSRYGARALIEHGAGGCMDTGGSSCTYHVSW